MLNDGFANIYLTPMLLSGPPGHGLTIGRLVLLANAMRDALEAAERSSAAKAGAAAHRRRPGSAATHPAQVRAAVDAGPNTSWSR